LGFFFCSQATTSCSTHSAMSGRLQKLL